MELRTLSTPLTLCRQALRRGLANHQFPRLHGFRRSAAAARQPNLQSPLCIRIDGAAVSVAITAVDGTQTLVPACSVAFHLGWVVAHRDRGWIALRRPGGYVRLPVRVVQGTEYVALGDLAQLSSDLRFHADPSRGVLDLLTPGSAPAA